MEQALRACPNCQTTLPTNAAFCYVCGVATPAGIDRRTGEFVAAGSVVVPMSELLPRLRALLGKSYDLGERIGAGGFAEVYLARDLRLKRDVAIKVTRPEFALNDQMMIRFRREAETIAALRHPHIMPIYDIGEAAGLAYLVMPFIRGESLKARLDRVKQLTPEQARGILLQAADALAAAHEAGVVHRDVKPDNIMLDRREDQVLLMDFGIAKALEASSDSAVLTSTGLVMGTPHYMSPEQAVGERDIDARADQYALGVIGYRMLTGTLPFEGPTVRSILSKQLLATPKPLLALAPDTPPALAATIEQAMAKEPDDRFASMRDLIADLRADPTYADEVLSVMRAETERMERRRTPPPTADVPAVVSVPAPPPQQKKRRGGLAWLAVPVIAAVAAGVAWQARRQPAGTPGPVPDRVAAPAPAPATASTAAPRADSAAGVTAATSDSAAAAAPLPDSVARKRASDSVSVARAGLKYGTPAADSFVARIARGRSACERPSASARPSDVLAVCGAFARIPSNAWAQLALGQLHERAGRYDSAAAWYKRLATKDPEAMVRLARLHDEGRGVPLDSAGATRLLVDAAGLGHVVGQRMLAQRLAVGYTGMPRDEPKAVSYFVSAAHAGDVPSMLALAEHYRSGRGVKKSDDSSAAWWQRAADRDDSTGEYWLGRAYLSGKGVRKSDSVAFIWLRRAAAKGHEGARFELEKRGQHP